MTQFFYMAAVDERVSEREEREREGEDTKTRKRKRSSHQA